MEDEFVTIDGACRMLSVSRRTVYNWLKQGKLAFMRTPSGRVRILSSLLLTKGKYRRERDPDEAV